jgi:hypothetical protein
MTLYGLPDFNQPIQGEGFQLFFPFEGGDAVLLPEELVLASDAAGNPDLALELVRRLGRFSIADTYGVLDLRVVPRDRGADGLGLLRETVPSATLRPAAFAGGFVRLQLLQPAGDAPVDLPEPAPLAADGLVTTRIVQKLTPALAALIKGALGGQALALTVVAELALRGVSPRLPLTIAFDPAALLATLLARAEEGRRIARADVLDLFRQDPTLLPIQLSGALPDGMGETFAQALADRVLARFGTFVAAPGERIEPTFALAAPGDVPDGSFSWDLSEPIQVVRPAVLWLDPLAAARSLVQEHGIEAVYREITVPAFPTGVLPVTVLANLPDQRPGVLEIGVTLNAPPDPPRRPQSAITTAVLTPPDDRATLALTLGAGAAPAYRYATYVVLAQGNGINRFESPEREHAGGWLSLSPSDFPVGFVAVEADRALLDLATLQGTVAWTSGMTQGSQSFALDRAVPALALAVPNDATDATIAIEAHARISGQALRLGPLPAKHLHLGVYSFAEYGPHTVSVTCAFDDASQLCAIELASEDRTETDGPPALLVFTPDRPARSWSWFARTPFAPGYRYRPRRDPDQAPAAWSEVQSPFEALTILSSQLAANAVVGA